MAIKAWEEDQSPYSTRHWRLRYERGPAKHHDCASCAEDGIRKRAMDWAQIHGETGENPFTDYVPLCRSCHIRYDKSGHRQPHTDETRAKMSVSQRRSYAEGRPINRGGGGRPGGSRQPGYTMGPRIGRNTYQSGKTHCRNGHEYDEENTYVNPKGERVCRKCRYDNLMRWKAKVKAQRAGG